MDIFRRITAYVATVKSASYHIPALRVKRK